eukprot:7590421-Pyramimonas_sp.AAC.1
MDGWNQRAERRTDGGHAGGPSSRSLGAGPLDHRVPRGDGEDGETCDARALGCAGARIAPGALT